MKNKILILLVLIISSCNFSKNFLDGTPLVTPEKFTFNLKNWDGIEREAEGANGEVYYLKIYKNQNTSDHQKLLDNQNFYYEGLFKEYKTPYPGILSNTKGCPVELTGKADISEDKSVFKVWAYANKRKVVGECLKKLNHYFFVKYIIRCPGDLDTYQLEAFLPFDHYEDLQDFKVTCRSSAP